MSLIFLEIWVYRHEDVPIFKMMKRKAGGALIRSLSVGSSFSKGKLLSGLLYVRWKKPQATKKVMRKAQQESES